MENNKVDKKKKITLLADLGLFIAAIIWGSSFPIGKIALDYYSPLFICTVRYFGGGVLLSVFVWKKLKNVTKKDLIGGFILGTIFYTAYLLQIIGLQYTSPSTQSFLAAVYVVIVPFMCWYAYKVRPDLYNCIAAVLTLLGIYLLTANGNLGFNKGDTITIFSSVLYALHIIVIGILVKKMDPILLTFLQTIFAGILALVVFLIAEPLPSVFPMAGVLSLLHLTVMCTIIAYMIQIVAQKYTSESKTAIILSLESVFGTLLSVIWLGDPFTPLMIVGCLLIFVAIITAETKWDFLKNKLSKEVKEVKGKK